MSDIEKLRIKHKTEVQVLQGHCPHLESKILAKGSVSHPFNFSHCVVICNNCGKELEKIAGDKILRKLDKKTNSYIYQRK